MTKREKDSNGLMAGDYWCTPKWLIHLCKDAMGGIDLDPCAGKHTEWGIENWCISNGTDGLTRSWKGHNRIYINPPYSAGQIVKWLNKVKAENPERAILVLPLASSPAWSWQAREMSSAVCELDRRVKFEHPNPTQREVNARGDTRVYFIGKDFNTFCQAFRSHGYPTVL